MSEDISKSLDLMTKEVEQAMFQEPNKEKEAVEERPVHRLEGILTMQHRTLEQAIAHRKEFEVTKEKNLKAINEVFREDIDRCDRKITQITEALGLLQKEKQNLYDGLEKRRQEIIDQFKADDEALMKIISAQRMVIMALGDDDERPATLPNGSRKPDTGNNKKQDTGKNEQRPN